MLVALGVLAAAGRFFALTNIATPFTDGRLRLVHRLYPAFRGDIPRIEQRFADAAPLTIVHVVTGAVFLVLGLLQFATPFRNRHPRFHRRTGYFLAALALVAGISGLWLGVVKPFASTERAPTAAAGVVFFMTAAIAIAAIRRGDIERHREWMIRFYAVGVGVVAVRLVSPIVIWLLAPAPFSKLIGVSFWAGWIVSVAVAEVWIRATRGRGAWGTCPLAVPGS